MHQVTRARSPAANINERLASPKYGTRSFRSESTSCRLLQNWNYEWDWTKTKSQARKVLQIRNDWRFLSKLDGDTTPPFISVWFAIADLQILRIHSRVTGRRQTRLSAYLQYLGRDGAETSDYNGDDSESSQFKIMDMIHVASPVSSESAKATPKVKCNITKYAREALQSGWKISASIWECWQAAIITLQSTGKLTNLLILVRHSKYLLRYINLV